MRLTKTDIGVAVVVGIVVITGLVTALVVQKEYVNVTITKTYISHGYRTYGMPYCSFEDSKGNTHFLYNCNSKVGDTIVAMHMPFTDQWGYDDRTTSPPN